MTGGPAGSPGFLEARGVPEKRSWTLVGLARRKRLWTRLSFVWQADRGNAQGRSARPRA